LFCEEEKIADKSKILQIYIEKSRKNIDEVAKGKDQKNMNGYNLKPEVDVKLQHMRRQ
jgi:hypothetical protein